MRRSTRSRCTGRVPGLIAAAVSQNAAGIVLAATGSGNTHPDDRPGGPGRCADGVVVVVTSRVPYGPIVPTYGGGGGAVDLERAGAIISRWLRAAGPDCAGPYCSRCRPRRRADRRILPGQRPGVDQLEAICPIPAVAQSPSMRLSRVGAAQFGARRPQTYDRPAGSVALVSKRTVTTPCPAPCNPTAVTVSA